MLLISRNLYNVIHLNLILNHNFLKFSLDLFPQLVIINKFYKILVRNKNYNCLFALIIFLECSNIFTKIDIH